MRTEILEYDLLVVGAGPGGLAAAYTAASNGVKTLLIDRNGYLGGNAASGIPFLGFYDSKARRVVGGFGDRVVKRFVEEGISEGYRICPKHQSMVTFDPDGAKLVYAKMLKEAGVDILLHCEAIDVTVENEEIRTVTLHGRGMRVIVHPKMVIDTGDAEITEMSGAAYEKGRKDDGVTQPPSIICTVANYDEEKFLQYLQDHPEDKGSEYPMEYLRASKNWCHVGLGALYRRLDPIGEWPMEIWASIMIKSPNEGMMYLNGPRMGGADATDLFSITQAELKGQQQAQDFLMVLRKYVPGFENAVLAKINSYIGIRETRRMMGTRLLTREMAEKAVVDEETIALAAYPIDIHGNDKTSKFFHLEEPFGIPYGALVSRSLKNLMAAGKCISVDAEVFGSTRVMAQCMAVGEAAGYGVYLALKNQITPAQVDVSEVRKMILANGGVLAADEKDVLHEATLGR